MYRVELARQAAKSLETIFRSDRPLYERFLNAFRSIARDPSQGKPLHGKLKGLNSYRMGSYRVVYETHRHRLLIIVIDLGHRKDIYR